MVEGSQIAEHTKQRNIIGAKSVNVETTDKTVVNLCTRDQTKGTDSTKKQVSKIALQTAMNYHLKTPEQPKTRIMPPLQ